MCDRFFFVLLHALNVGGAGTFFSLLGVEGNLVALMQLVKGDVDERGAVEKDILVAAVRGNEAKTFFAIKALDDTSHNLVFY